MKPSIALPPNHSSERFHALDASRAFALLLGVIFHGAWFYTLQPTGTGVKDVSANHAFSWFFHASHTFRMQLFFLIAGFFARLVCERRGVRRFIQNRLIRIGVPLLIGWFILFPALVMVWIWGKNLSGQNPVALPPFATVLGLFESGKIFVDRSNGGAFGFGHLWFLYYLLILCAITLTGRTILLRTPLSRESVLAQFDRFVRFLTASPAGALVLALLLTPVIWSMTGWLGIDTPNQSQKPALRVVVAYLAFFLLGWFVQRQSCHPGVLFRQWRFYLSAGLIASVGLYIFHNEFHSKHPDHPRHSLSYPEIEDWSAFQASLTADSAAAEAQRQLWSAFHPRVKDYIETENTTFGQRMAILTAVNKELTNREALPLHLRGFGSGNLPDVRWYWSTKLAFSALYSVVMVFLVYGCLGAFQAMCQGFSPIWRYLADSSYWVYLLHLPLLPAIETLVFDWPVTAWIKLPTICVVSLAILYASYHYLVRSTFVGRFLNGRAYAFHWNPLHALKVNSPPNPTVKAIPSIR
ncbi:MAG: peptidoglycan/LPS O-acetylase OafA/YrhL [Verrucomicrobiales bacterium]|jgi:peptidoglycan/LPS O-acetylase OafA/YrhL